MCQCMGCKRYFGGTGSFDIHRVGSFSKRERRCMSDEEMEAKGLKFINGKWSREITAFVKEIANV